MKVTHRRQRRGYRRVRVGDPFVHGNRDAADTATVANLVAVNESLREALENLDEFDLVQLAHVVRVCRRSRTMAEAGRTLFAASRREKENPNDADRVRKYLLRFGLSFPALTPT